MPSVGDEIKKVSLGRSIELLSGDNFSHWQLWSYWDYT